MRTDARDGIEPGREGRGIHARIKGRFERQTLATFELVATELVLVEPTDPIKAFVPTELSLDRSKTRDRDVASSDGGSAGAGGSGDAGAGNSGVGNSGGGQGKSKDKGKGQGKGKGKK